MLSRRRLHVPREPYIPISFPEGMVERVDAIVAMPEQGFATRADFARTALRRFLESQERRLYRDLALQGPSKAKAPILRQMRRRK